jgi:hypothetical protein
VVRENKVRVSDEELNALKEYRDTNYDDSIPLGFIIGELVDGEV